VKVFKVSGKKLLAGIGIILLLGTTAGCGDDEKFSWDNLKETHYRMIAGEEFYEKMKMAQEDAVNEGQIPVSDPVDNQENQESEINSETEGTKKVEVSLYFSDQNGDYLQVEKRGIAMVPGLARATVNELIAGPKNTGLLRTIPEGTQLLDINIENGLCTVDLSNEFRENHWGGSSGEILTVYSLVDTLTQFPTVDEVEILVEGQQVETLAGHMDLSTSVIQNMQIVKETE